METKLKVKKRDTSLEDFSYDKIIASLTKTGLSVKDAELVTQDIVGWAISNAVDNTITSVELRDAIIKRLSQEFPVEADSYSIYKKD